MKKHVRLLGMGGYRSDVKTMLELFGFYEKLPTIVYS